VEEGLSVHVEVDQKRCAGHGQCAATAPEIYELDDDGFCLPVGEVPDSVAEDAREGAYACPETAIELRE